jgi:hypothetical protein
MFGLLDWIKIGAGGLAGAALIAAPVFFYGKRSERRTSSRSLKTTASPLFRTGRKSMKTFLRLTTLLCVACSVAACQTRGLTNPCDVLVPIDAKPATNSYLVANDRETAVSIARHRGRFQQYNCGVH